MVEEFAFDNSAERRQVRHNGTGWIEVIAGSMFSGKSEELIRRLTRARIARQKVQVFKPGIDMRYSDEQIASHSGQKHISIPVATTEEMMKQIDDDTQVIGIDEAQFFDLAIIDAVNRLAEQGKRIIIAGLDQDYTGKPFEPMPQLLSIAEFITKTHAICVRCGATANYSQRTVESDARVEVGASDKYEARCRKCFVPHADTPTLPEMAAEQAA
jgi:thymidine kinase